MAANIFGRYVWLVDTILKHKQLTFEEINRRWQLSGLSYGEGDELPLRTFHNHRQAIRDIFDIDIECDKRNGYKYYIRHPDRLGNDNLRRWLLDSYATLNQIQAEKKLSGRIIFENIPSGNHWLTTIVDAMRRNHVITVTHRGFNRPEAKTFQVEPYFLKVVNRRWYLLGRSPYYSARNRAEGREPEDVYRIYALDRISEVVEEEETFSMKEDFDIDRYFDGCCGVIVSEEPPVEVVLRADRYFADYLRTLPLHASQRELDSPDGVARFAYRVRLTYDFYQLLLAQGTQIEVLSPESVREEMKNLSQALLNFYGTAEKEKKCTEKP